MTSVGPARLAQLQLLLTERCNLRCAHCAVPEETSPALSELTGEDSGAIPDGGDRSRHSDRRTVGWRSVAAPRLHWDRGACSVRRRRERRDCHQRHCSAVHDLRATGQPSATLAIVARACQFRRCRSGVARRHSRRRNIQSDDGRPESTACLRRAGRWDAHGVASAQPTRACCLGRARPISRRSDMDGVPSSSIRTWSGPRPTPPR